jgi:serine/threonine protein kinase
LICAEFLATLFFTPKGPAMSRLLPAPLAKCLDKCARHQEVISWNDAYDRLAHKTTAEHRETMEQIAKDEFHQEERTSFIAKRDADERLTQVNDYKLRKALGKGSFGEVFLAWRGWERFAIKILRKSALKKMKTGRGSALDSVKTEVATMKKIAHPNCVHMYDVVVDPGHDEVIIVLEFVDGGPSQRHTADGSAIPLPELTIWSHLRHLIMGLEYLHSHGIVHRDLKPENLMVTQPGTMYYGGCGVLKIADFGTSYLCEGDANAQKTPGTPAFFAPELCTKDTHGSFDDRHVDLWAVGVTIYMWVSGRTPFNAATVMLLMEAIAAAPKRVAAPEEAIAVGLRSVIEGLLTRDPAKRLTLHQLRLHDWPTSRGSDPLPPQPIMHIEVSQEEIEQVGGAGSRQVASGGRWQQVAGGSRWQQVVAGGSRWQQVASTRHQVAGTRQ